MEKSINDNNKYKNARGFILANDIGLGKTVNIINVMLDNLSKNQFTIDDQYVYSPASLVIAPSHICQQWKSEINKFSNDILVPKVITDMIEYRLITMKDIKNPNVVLIIS